MKLSVQTHVLRVDEVEPPCAKMLEILERSTACTLMMPLPDGKLIDLQSIMKTNEPLTNEVVYAAIGNLVPEGETAINLCEGDDKVYLIEFTTTPDKRASNLPANPQLN